MATQPISGVGAISDAQGARPHLGKRHLTTTHAIGQALAIGPIFSVGLVSGLVANVAGYSTPAAIVLGSIVTYIPLVAMSTPSPCESTKLSST